MNYLKIILTLIFTLHLTIAQAEDIYSFTSIQDQQRFQELSYQVRCITCQNQSLAESSAPIAVDLRQKIYGMVSEGKSNQEIKAYLVKRYGEFILLEPPMNKSTLFLWACPIFLLLIAASGFVYLLRRAK